MNGPLPLYSSISMYIHSRLHVKCNAFREQAPTFVRANLTSAGVALFMSVAPRGNGLLNISALLFLGVRLLLQIDWYQKAPFAPKRCLTRSYFSGRVLSRLFQPTSTHSVFPSFFPLSGGQERGKGDV